MLLSGVLTLKCSVIVRKVRDLSQPLFCCLSSYYWRCSQLGQAGWVTTSQHFSTELFIKWPEPGARVRSRSDLLGDWISFIQHCRLWSRVESVQSRVSQQQSSRYNNCAESCWLWLSMICKDLILTGVAAAVVLRCRLSVSSHSTLSYCWALHTDLSSLCCPLDLRSPITRLQSR